MSVPLSHRAAWHDVPLPGFHKCLTWQLNATLHVPQHSAKFVSILRDPDAQVELSRAGLPLVSDVDLVSALSVHFNDCIGILKHLGGIPGAPVPR